jgi:hypothetical protein
LRDCHFQPKRHHSLITVHCLFPSKNRGKLPVKMKKTSHQTHGNTHDFHHQPISSPSCPSSPRGTNNVEEITTNNPAGAGLSVSQSTQNTLFQEYPHMEINTEGDKD